MLIAGDVFDSDIRSLSAQVHFQRGMTRLQENGIQVYLICGNHDPLNEWSSSLQLPGNVHTFSGQEVERHHFTRDNQWQADIFGISYPQREVRQNLAEQFQGVTTEAPFVIGLLHATVGSPGVHENYAPCSKDDLAASPVQYWALGHIHKREVISQADPAIVYPGNPQGRDFGETGTKGCYLVEWERGLSPKLLFKPLHKVRFEEREVDISGTEETEALIDRIYDALSEDERPDGEHGCLLRLTLRGRTSLHRLLSNQEDVNELINRFNEGALSSEPFTWVDTIRVETTPDIDLAQRAEGNDFVGEVIRKFNELKQDDETLHQLMQKLSGHFSSQRYKELEQPSGEKLQKLLDRARGKTLEQLLKDE